MLEMEAVKDNSDVLLCPMIDARRMEVYTTLFDTRMESQSEITAKITDGESFSEILKSGKVVFAGNGVDKCRSDCASQCPVCGRLCAISGTYGEVRVSSFQ